MNEENKVIRVLLATPSYDGRFDVRYVDSLLQTNELCIRNNIQILPYFLCYDSLIQRARNDYFRTAYQTGVDVLFFIDSDIGWNPQDFVKLVLSDKDMIGGTYRKKTDNEELYAFKAVGNTQKDFKIVPDADGLLEVSGLGCGFLKLSRKCIVELFESEKNYYTNDADTGGAMKITKNVCECVINSNNNFVSEDIIMGFKWQQLGYKVYLDTNIDLVHVGAKDYTGSVREWLSNWKRRFDNQPVQEENTISKYFFGVPQNSDAAGASPSSDDMFKVL